MPENKTINEPLTAPSPTLTPSEDKAPAAISSRFAWKNIFSRKNKPADGIDIFKAIKYIYPLTIFIIVLILIWVMSFLYNNVYLTMTQAEIVSSLKSKVIEESVDFSKFNDIVKKIADKKSLGSWPNLKYLTSPFSYGVRLSYPGVSSTTAGQATSTQPAGMATASSTGTSTLNKISTTTKSTSTKF